MTKVIKQMRDEILTKVVSLIEKNLPQQQSKLLSEFVQQYYAFVAEEELQTRVPLDLYSAVLSHWNLAYKRAQGEIKVHVYNPDFEQHGWQSRHTIIEISMDNMPFLVDSVRMEVNRLGFTSHLMINMGGMNIKRDEQDQITQVMPLNQAGKVSHTEAPIYVEVDKQTDPKILDELRDNLHRVLQDVEDAVADWDPMQNKLAEALDELELISNKVSLPEVEESKDFLQWLVEDNFTFLGYQEHEICHNKGSAHIATVPGSGLGVLRNASKERVVQSLDLMPPEAQRLAMSSDVLIVSKTNTVSTIHRPVYTDYIGVKRFDKNGKPIGERRFIGLYTSTAYHSNPSKIPLLRLKVEKILKNSNLPPNGHSAKDLINILEALPRDDLFQCTVEELLELSMGILHLQERKRIRVFARKDVYGRFVSCLIYVPKDIFNTELRSVFQDILMTEFNGNDVSYYTMFSESVLARIHMIVRVDPTIPLELDVASLENKLIEAGRGWKEELHDNLIDFFGEEKGTHLFLSYGDAFQAGYRETFPTTTAVYDIKNIENLKTNDSLGMSFYHPLEGAGDTLRFKLYHHCDTVPLSDALPMLENMGLRVIGEKPYEINLKNKKKVWINDFSMVYQTSTLLDIDSVKEFFKEAFEKTWHGIADNDGFNRLILGARLNWREVAMLRSYARYLRQIGITFSQQYIQETLWQNTNLVRTLVDCFNVKFNPANTPVDKSKLKELETLFSKQLEGVLNLDQDRILRRFYDVLQATVRTNFFQKNEQGQVKEYISFKFRPDRIPDMPKPWPMFEIYVYSPRFEAVHLRTSKVARGGLRWSDRMEDFRTEVLGLVKAQKVKNAVIVPSGAKGGFVVQHLPVDGDREALMAEVTACYRSFISGMLDITDNLVDGNYIPPQDVVRYDEDDAYLVVAADKGTATFSDIANEVAAQYGFWLGDAFASGGSVGYDHKKMGITAKGAWESVKRNFIELGHDTQSADFTVVGIGDMAGDVFGNGMLLSKHIRLVAAFNHMHIFIDPNPDAKSSYQERHRLFNLPRSTWEDYEVKLISKGGGVFKRSAKSIKLTPEIKKSLGIKKDTVIPTELIKAILRAKIDLLWNGGIGTYVKATNETHLDVGDRANDAVRINGDELRCRVVGEGGNLGLTQLGRTEYALKGGLVNTDFIDNSAGVDCSDHEVNIKILLNGIVASGDMTQKKRNQLLVEMTDDVSVLVLRNNYKQNLALSLAASQSMENSDLYQRYLASLERSGKIDRELEFLPTEKQMTQRKANGQSFTRPELAVLLAYTKTTLKDIILESSLPEEPLLAQSVFDAFPQKLCEEYFEEIKQHGLLRFIIATQLSNAVTNQMGITFMQRLQDETGASVADIVRAYAIAKEIFRLDLFWEEVDSMAKSIDVSIQVKIIQRIIRLIRRCTRWLLRHREYCGDLQDTIEYFTTRKDELYAALPETLVGVELESYNALYKEFIDAGVSESLSAQAASTSALFSSLDIIGAVRRYNMPVQNVAEVFYKIGAKLQTDWLRAKVIYHSVDNNWESLSRAMLRDDLTWEQIELVISVLKFKTDAKTVDERINEWMACNKEIVERWLTMLADFRSSSSVSFTMFFVTVRELLSVVQESRRSNLIRLARKVN